MARVRSFETAAARRRKDPLTLEIDGKPISLVASIDLAELADLIESLQSNAGDDTTLKSAAEKRQTLIKIVRRFVIENNHGTFDSLTDDLDIYVLSEMMQDLIGEYSGAKNPTKPQSSADGSLETGETLMAGAEQEV